MTTREELEGLPTKELYDRTIGIAKRRLDVGFFWDLLKALPVAEEVSAGKNPHGRKEALALARSARRLIAAKGAKVTVLDLSSGPPDKEVLALVLGPTGKLRAPAMRVGDTLYIGFPKGGFEGLT